MLPIQIYQDRPYYVLSMSALQTFKRCRKAFDLGYLRGYETRALPGAMVAGRSIHEHLAAMSTGAYSVLQLAQRGDEEAKIAWTYGEHRPVPSGDRVIAVEQGFYLVLIEPTTDTRPGVILRCTFDLAYWFGEPNDTHRVLRDYKSFEKAPTLHVDLDFQGRLYTAFGMRLWNTNKVFFEYEYIRRALPNVPKPTKKGDAWSPDDCYINQQLVISPREADELWRETQDVAYDLVRAINEERLYRVDLKAGPHACSSCLWRHGCVAEVQQGVLDEQTADMFYTVREPMRLPESVTL